MVSCINSGSKVGTMGGGGSNDDSSDYTSNKFIKPLKKKKGPSVEKIKEPIVDIFPEDELITVIVEMPGVEKDDIQLELKEDILTLSAVKYQKEILLPRICNDMECWTYKNGMLEIIVK